MTKPVPKSEAVISIGTAIILSLITCLIYNIYWNYRQMQTLNGLLGREEFNFGTWLLLTIVTCGIYHIYYEYKMGKGMIELQQKYQIHVDHNLPLISLILSLFGLSIVVDAIHQGEINEIYEKMV